MSVENLFDNAQPVRASSRNRRIPERYRDTPDNPAEPCSFQFPSAEAIKSDAEKYGKELEKLTRFERCGLCGIDESAGSVVSKDTIFQKVQETNHYRSLREELITTTHLSYAMAVETEIDEDGILRGWEFLCATCARKLCEWHRRERSVRNVREETDAPAEEGDGDESADDAKPMRELALVSGLFCGAIPDELSELTPVELSLVSMINPICTTVMTGKFAESRSKVFCVINSVDEVVRKLPNFKSLEQMASFRSTNSDNPRSYSYSPRKVMVALEWLKRHNRFYRSTTLEYPDDWMGDPESPRSLPNSQLIPPDDEDNMAEAFQEDPGCREGHASLSYEEELILPDDTIDAPDSVFVRQRGAKVDRHNTPDFFYLAFVILFPYGYGYNPSLSDSVYAAYTMKYGGDRRFQRYFPWYFFMYYEITSRRISGISSRMSDLAANREHISSASRGLHGPSLRAGDMLKFYEHVESQDHGGLVTASADDASTHVMSQVEVDRYMRMLQPYSMSLPGTPTYITQMRRNVLSMVNNSLVNDKGVWAWFNTMSPSDTHCPILFTNLEKRVGVSWDAATNIAASRSDKDRLASLKAHPALSARIFHLKQKCIFDCILNGKAKPLGNIVDFFSRTEFQQRGSPHIHRLLTIAHGAVKPEWTTGTESEQEAVKALVAHTLTAELYPRPSGDRTHLRGQEIAREFHEEFEEDEDYNPKVSLLFQAPECRRDDPVRSHFDATLNYEYNESGACDPQVSKLYRNLQLGKFMHKCTSCCWKYNKRKHDKTCRFGFPKLPPSVSPTDVIVSESPIGTRGRIRTRVEPKRNNNHINACVRSPLLHLAHASNYDFQFISDCRGAAEYAASYSLKQEQPDNKKLHRLLDKLLADRGVQETSSEILRNRIRTVGMALLSSTTVGACQACYFLLNLPFVESSREFFGVNTLQEHALSVSLITDRCQLEALPPDASAIRQPGPRSQLGLRRAYAALARQQVEAKRSNGATELRKRLSCDISFNAFISNFKVTAATPSKRQKYRHAPPILMMGTRQENGGSDHLVVPRNAAKLEQSNNFVIEDYAYSRYADGKEPVLVYNPHFYVDNGDERSCFATLLLHLPWGEQGEAGLLRHPLITKEAFPDAVTAMSYHLKTPSSFPAYLPRMLSNVRQAQERLRVRQEDAADAARLRHESTVNHTVDGDDDEEQALSSNVAYYYLRSSDDSDIDNFADLDDETATHVYTASPFVRRTLTSADRILYTNYIKQQREEAQSQYERSNEIPPDVQRHMVSISAGDGTTTVSTMVKYPNHDDIKRAFFEAYHTKLGVDQRSAVRRIVAGMKDNSDRMLFFLSGAGGTGKSECIKLLADAAKLIFGMGGPYEPLISVAPTGSAACNIDGYTWHSILGVDRKKGIISLTSAQRLANRLKGTHIIVIDEVSLLGCEDLYTIHENLRAARQASWAISPEDIERRDSLSKKPFGGFKIVFSGDFYQLPPVRQKALYTPQNAGPRRANLQALHREKEGRLLWENVSQFQELTENFRFKSVDANATTVLAEFLDGARVGQPNGDLLRQINANCLVLGTASCHVDERALWMAPTNREVDTYNKVAFKRLSDEGRPRYRSICVHSTAVDTSSSHRVMTEMQRLRLAESLFKVTTNPMNTDQLGNMPPPCVDFIVGQRVRCTRNLATQLGIFQGALGTVYGFIFDTNKPLTDKLMWPEDISGPRLSICHRQDNLPVILVRMDRLKCNISCVPGEPNIIPFVQERHTVPITIRGTPYYRCQYPLVPAQATTMHRSQGLTASFGGVFQPSESGKQMKFGMHYVALSRVTTIDRRVEAPYYNNLTLLTYKLQESHFTSHGIILQQIHTEYDRLRNLPIRNTDEIYFI